MKELIGMELTFDELYELCVRHNKTALVEYMRTLNRDDYKNFKSDGCSWWPDEWKLTCVDLDLDLSDDCFWHDVPYFLGGPLWRKVAADKELFNSVRLKSIMMASIMWAGVTPGGLIPRTGFEWGYGRIKK